MTRAILGVVDVVGSVAVGPGGVAQGHELVPERAAACSPSSIRRTTPRHGKKTRVAVKLRLMRMGKKKQPTYRVVAADSRSPRNGRFIEIVGIYDPRPDPSAIRIDNDKAVDWLRKGAQPTDSVRKLLEI